MTIKFKILSAISFISLAIVLTFVGVWAVTDLDFSVGGNITYTAPVEEIKDVSNYPTLQFIVQTSANKTVAVQQNIENKPIGELVIPSKVLSGGEEYTVTTMTSYTSELVPLSLPTMRAIIPDEDILYAFEKCTDLISITIPETIVDIYTMSFASCTNLEIVEILASTPPSAGRYIFSECTSLTTIKVPNESLEAYKTATNWSVYANLMVGV